MAASVGGRLTCIAGEDGSAHRDHSCPQAAEIEKYILAQNVAWESRMAASLAMLYFHDCIVQDIDWVKRYKPWAEEKKKWTNTFRFDPKTLDEPKELDVIKENNTWKDYMGCSIKQTNASCFLVASLQCLDICYRIQHGNKGRAFPDTIIADGALRKLQERCAENKTWEEYVGTHNPGGVLKTMQEMGNDDLLMTDESTSSSHASPLFSWQGHGMFEGDSSAAMLRGLVVHQLDDHGPFVGCLWVLPWYKYMDADRDHALVYNGCGLSQANRDLSKILYPPVEAADGRKIAQVGGHAVLCYGYRVHRDRNIDVFVLDNHATTGPRRWVDVLEFFAIFTLNVSIY